MPADLIWLADIQQYWDEQRRIFEVLLAVVQLTFNFGTFNQILINYLPACNHQAGKVLIRTEHTEYRGKVLSIKSQVTASRLTSRY